MLALFTNLDYRQIQEHDGGLLWLALLVFGIFAVAVPCCAIWLLFRRRSVRGSVAMAGDFTLRAFEIIMIILLGAPLCLVAVGVPFAILNFIGSAIFGRDFYWPFLAPALLVVIGVPGWILLKAVRSDHRREREAAAQPNQTLQPTVGRSDV